MKALFREIKMLPEILQISRRFLFSLENEKAITLFSLSFWYFSFISLIFFPHQSLTEISWTSWKVLLWYILKVVFHTPKWNFDVQQNEKESLIRLYMPKSLVLGRNDGNIKLIFREVKMLVRIFLISRRYWFSLENKEAITLFFRLSAI